MTNKFLQVNKDLFNLGLNPTELIILAQVLEYNRTTGVCYMSNEQFAAMLNVSESSIKRAMDKLESEGLIKRETKNTRNGRERKIYPTSKLTLASSEESK